MLPTGRHCVSSISSLMSSILARTRTTFLCWSRLPKMWSYFTWCALWCSSGVSFSRSTLHWSMWNWLSIASKSLQFILHLWLLPYRDEKFDLIFFVIELLILNKTWTILFVNVWEFKYGWILKVSYLMSLTLVCVFWINLSSFKAASLIFFLMWDLNWLLDSDLIYSSLKSCPIYASSNEMH